MGLFDRLRRRDDEPRQKADRLVVEGEDDVDVDDEFDDDEDDRFDEKSAPDDREENGPFDVNEANPAKRYVDLGAIRIPARDGLGLRLEVEEKSKRLVAVALDYKGSTMQVQAFAAPRSSGLWHPIRQQLAEQVEKQGGSATEIDADLGTVLDTQLPVMVGGKRSSQRRSARFIGVDGPRWFLRGVLTGEALRDEQARDDMEALFRSIVVVRGDEAMPPRELLPLVVPKAMAEHMAASKQARATADQTASSNAIAEGASGTPGKNAAGASAPDAAGTDSGTSRRLSSGASTRTGRRAKRDG